ncbi:MAG: FtsX-like permease family protein [Thermoleophilia bacterium]|nr:FtsX-like permease family protein [Thermoleophilia bacterium]
MIRVALRGLAGRKLRALLTALAIVLGVAMIAGTYVLTDTIDRAFATVFTKAYAGTDAVVTGKEAFTTDFGLPPPFDEGLLERVRALPEAEAAAGGISDIARLTAKDGSLISTQGAPALAFGIDASEERFNALDLVAGEWAAGPGEVVIDAGTAADEGYTVGDEIGVVARGPVERFTISGVARFGEVDSIGSATFAAFDVATAQRLFAKQGKLDGIQVAARDGVSPQQLVDAIAPILPPGSEVRTGTQEAADATKDVEGFTKFIRYFLLAFGGIALFVGAFVIFNTLSITVAQRVREFATLRTIGASRRQVLGSVVLEALAIGLIASVAGLFLGLGLAKGLDSVLRSLGLDLPTAGIVFAARTVVVSLLAGVAITLVAGFVPALRATRVPPIAAVREGATLPPSRLARFAPWLAGLAALAGVALLVYGMFAGELGIGPRLGSIGAGCLLLFVGVAGFASRLVRPLASVLGWPALRLGGAAGKLARENAMRNPGRTAATAAALMIGLALITFVAVLAQGLRSSIVDAIDRQVTAAYVVVSEDNFSPFGPAADAALAGVEGATVVGVRGDRARVAGSQENVTGVDPAAVGAVYTFDWQDGSDAVLAGLGSDGAIVEESFATGKGLRVGSRFLLETATGGRLELEVKGLYEAPPFWEMLGKVSIPAETFDATFQDPRNLYTLVAMPGGATDANEAGLAAALESFPTVKLDTKKGFSKTSQESLDPFLNLLYVLLALSVIVSLFGIVNTLVLSVFERTRELGMLRAVGMTRRQVRRMIRHESVITALIGAALGLALGIFLAALVTQALSSEGVVFAVPVASLVVFALVAVVAGLVAAILPARRAARLNVLAALQYE